MGELMGILANSQNGTIKVSNADSVGKSWKQRCEEEKTTLSEKIIARETLWAVEAGRYSPATRAQPRPSGGRKKWPILTNPANTRKSVFTRQQINFFSHYNFLQSYQIS
jgi:hypothetical protein